MNTMIQEKIKEKRLGECSGRNLKDILTSFYKGKVRSD